MDNRRSFLRNLGLATAIGTVPANYATAQPMTSSPKPRSTLRRGEQILFGSSAPVVRTTAGSLRGYIRNGVHTFKGIPYAAPTSGQNRFKPPQALEPWEGVYDAVAYGYAAPQQHGDDWKNPLSHFIMNFDAGLMSEACLNLNVWTPAPDGRRRPVIVWIHGGGWTNGSSFEMLPYDGENLVRRGDCVFVSINHRLNVLGFLDLSSVGSEHFAHSGNASILDLITALEWVRDNISAFGGDPKSITICGHSGGGGKVNALMRAPRASGLFHRAIIQSGSFRSYRDPFNSRQVGERLMASLGLGRDDLSQLQQMPFADLLASASKVIGDLERAQPAKERHLFSDYGWGPVADGEVIVANEKPEIDPSLPLLIGYTRYELASPAYNPALKVGSMEEAAANASKIFPGKGPALVAKVRELYPDATPEFASCVASSFMLADASITQLNDRAAAPGSGPAWGYRFDWNSDIWDGRMGAFHSLEIGFAFDNTERWASATGGGERAQSLAAIMSDSWINFVRFGNPSHPELGRWKPYDIRDKSVMIFDDMSQIRHDPDGAFHKLLAS